MSDLHQRLLAELDPTVPWDDQRDEHVYAALRAVVELHEPEQHYAIGQDNKRRPTWLWCNRCRQKSPCEEIQAIADQLGLTEGNDHRG